MFLFSLQVIVQSRPIVIKRNSQLGKRDVGKYGKVKRTIYTAKTHLNHRLKL